MGKVRTETCCFFVCNDGFFIMTRSKHLLSQWLTFIFFWITYLVGKITFELFFSWPFGCVRIQSCFENIHPGKLTWNPKRRWMEDDFPFPGLYSQVRGVKKVVLKT